MSGPLERDRLVRAFVAGAKWWEYHQTGATMWNSDQHLAMDEAERREASGTLGDGEQDMVERLRRWREETCAWTYDDTEDSWSSSCGEKWTFMEGDPEENNIRYCHSCGRPMKVVVPEPEEELEE